MELTGVSTPSTLCSPDIALYFEEAIVSVYNSGEWIADLEFPKPRRRPFALPNSSIWIDCTHGTESGFLYTSITNWEELFDPPDSFGGRTVATVQTNTFAIASRMAVAHIGEQLGYQVLVLPDNGVECLDCLMKSQIHGNADMGGRISEYSGVGSQENRPSAENIVLLVCGRKVHVPKRMKTLNVIIKHRSLVSKSF